MRKWIALAGVVLGACVTESLSICINCGGFRVADMQGGFTVVLTAHAGATLQCDDLRAQMDTPITWDGCLSPRGGTRDSVHGIIRLAFVDSTGVAGALEFFDIQGDADSAMASWRSSCTKLDQTVSDCPRGEGAARWLPLATEETAGRESDPQPHP